MRVVCSAEDTNLKRPVPLKFLAAHWLGEQDIKARFQVTIMDFSFAP